MIIVNQDKDVILNFNNVSLIAIDDEETNRGIYASCNNDDVLKLGVYESNERAKEVLQEIITAYTGDGIVENEGYVCYEMPEK